MVYGLVKIRNSLSWVERTGIQQTGLAPHYFCCVCDRCMALTWDQAQFSRFSYSLFNDSLRKHPFLLALCRWGCFARRNGRSSVQNVPSGEERGETDVFVGYFNECYFQSETKIEPDLRLAWPWKCKCHASYFHSFKPLHPFPDFAPEIKTIICYRVFFFKEGLELNITSNLWKFWHFNSPEGYVELSNFISKSTSEYNGLPWYNCNVSKVV